MRRARIAVVAVAVSFVPTPVLAAPLRVLTTSPALADLAASVGGGDVSVSSLVSGAQDPHRVDPRPDQIRQLAQADALLVIGLGIEDGWLPPLLTASRNEKIQPKGSGFLDASRLIEVREAPPAGQGARLPADMHSRGNPHYLLDPRNGARVAKGISELFKRLLPEKVREIETRAKAFEDELSRRSAAWAKAFKPWAGLAVVGYHASWGYFCSWSGLVDAGTIEPRPGFPPSPEDWVKLSTVLKPKKVRLVIVEPYSPDGAAEQLALELGARVVALPTEVGGTPGAKTYFGIFDEAVVRIKGGSSPQAEPRPKPKPKPKPSPSPAPSPLPSGTPSASPSGIPSVSPSASASALPEPGASTGPAVTGTPSPLPGPSGSPAPGDSAPPARQASPLPGPSGSPAPGKSAPPAHRASPLPATMPIPSARPPTAPSPAPSPSFEAEPEPAPLELPPDSTTLPAQPPPEEAPVDRGV